MLGWSASCPDTRSRSSCRLPVIETRQTAKAFTALDPPYLYTAANIERLQQSLKEMFLTGDNPLTRNYLRFLVEGITVTDEQIDISARTDAALRLMAGGSRQEKTEGANPSVVSPTMGLDWLPNDASSANFESGYVIDLDKARKRLRPKKLEPPTIVKRLAQAEEWQRQIDAGEVKHRAEISHREGVSRARVTQIMHLLRLHPALLDYVRNLGPETPETPERMVTERKVRALMRLDPEKQLQAARFLVRGFSEFCS